MKKFLLLIISLLSVWGCSQADGFIIDKDNTYIVIDSSPSNTTLLAAHELQYFIKQSTGIELPIVKENPGQGKRMICIGKSSATTELDTVQFQEQEYLIKINPNKIILMGNDTNEGSDVGRDNNGVNPATDRIHINYSKLVNDKAGNIELTLPSIYDAQGTCYAVYDFLEKYMGVRFYGPHPSNVIVPTTTELQFSDSFIRRTPTIKYRGGTYSFNWPMIKDQYFNASKEMQQLFLRRIKFGGRKWAANHAFTGFQDRFLKKNPDNPELFEAYHPEFFAKGRDGGADQRQFCYTNKNFIHQVAKDACEYFEGKPLKKNQVAIGDYFALVPLDNAIWCRCDECLSQLKIDKNNIRGEHFNCGTATHYLWNFVNNVAKEIKEKHPDKKLSALAYHVYAYLPKDIKLESNIAVAPCLHPRNYWAPGMKRNERQYYKEWIAESKESKRDIFLWNYLCFPTERGLIQNFNVFPGFDIHNVSEEIKMYAQDGVKGIFLCGIGEQIDFYITMKLYDNPELNVDEILDEFFTSYFGKASEPMQKFYNKIEEVYSDTKNYPLDVQTKEAQYHQTEEMAWEYLGTEGVMQELENYVNQALATETSNIEKERVKTWVDGIWEYMKTGREKYFKKKNQ